jgi:hypothetical protein
MLKEIGEQLGVTRERVRLIETEALDKMADSMVCKIPTNGSSVNELGARSDKVRAYFALKV